MDPFNPHDIARARHAKTENQRSNRETEWAHQVDPHLSNDQLRSLYDIAEVLLERGFDGTYNQTMRLARAIRTALSANRQLTLGAPQPSAIGPRMQALRATPNVQTPALPSAMVQALTNARDLPAPSAAGETAPAAGANPSTAGNTAPAPDEIGSQAGQSPRESTHAEDETRTSAQQAPSAANDTASYAAQSPAADDHISVLAGTKRKRSIITSDEESDENAPVTRFGTIASDVKEEQNDPAAQSETIV